MCVCVFSMCETWFSSWLVDAPDGTFLNIEHQGKWSGTAREKNIALHFPFRKNHSACLLHTSFFSPQDVVSVSSSMSMARPGSRQNSRTGVPAVIVTSSSSKNSSGGMNCPGFFIFSFYYCFHFEGGVSCPADLFELFEAFYLTLPLCFPSLSPCVQCWPWYILIFGFMKFHSFKSIFCFTLPYFLWPPPETCIYWCIHILFVLLFLFLDPSPLPALFKESS